MAAPITFSGLASGIDSSSLIAQLVSAERAPATRIASQQSDLNTQKSIVGSLSSALAAFGTAVQGLSLPSEVQPRTATASDGHVTVAASSGAVATVHSVVVKSLARGEITSSNAFNTNGPVGDGSVTISVGSNSQQINYTSTDSLSDIATKINNANVGASASVLFDGSKYRLMVASTGTGTANAATFTETGTALGLADPNNIKVPAQDAVANIDGVDVTRSTNVIDDAVSNVTFTLVSPQAATDPATAVTVGLDTNAITNQLQQIVSAYNSVNGALHVQLDYTGTPKGTDTLFGDSTLIGLQGALGNLMAKGYGSDPQNPLTLGALGLTRDKDGNLSLDTTKLQAALAKNPNAVGDLFVTGGFAAAVQTMTDAYTRPGDGMFATKTQAMNDQFNVLQTQADQINQRADALQTQLQAQFAALESAMSTLKSQGSQLTSILG